MEAMRHLAPRTEAWYQAAAEVALASGPLGHHRRVAELGEQLAERWRKQVPSLAESVALAATATHLLLSGQGELAQTLLTRLAKASDPNDGPSPAVLARVTQARAVRAETAGDPAQTLSLLRRCVSYFESAGDLRNACIQRGNAGYVYLELGDHDRAEIELRAALGQARRLRLAAVAAAIRQSLSHALCRAGRFEQAIELGLQATRELAEHGNRRTLSAGHGHLAEAYLAVGDFRAAIAPRSSPSEG